MFLLGGVSDLWFQGVYPTLSTVILLIGGTDTEFGEVEMARMQKAEDQRREVLVEKVFQNSAWASWRALLAPKLLKCKVTLHKVGLKAPKGCQGKNSQSSHRTERSSD